MEMVKRDLEGLESQRMGENWWKREKTLFCKSLGASMIKNPGINDPSHDRPWLVPPIIDHGKRKKKKKN